MKKPLKGVMLLPCLIGGGAENVAIDIVSGISKENIVFSICCLKEIDSEYFYLKDELSKKGIKVETLTNQKTIGFTCFFKLVSYLRKEKPDLVHTHLFGADVLGSLACWFVGIKTVISTEHNLNFTEGAFKKIAKKISASLRTITVAVSKTVLDYAIQHEGVTGKKSMVIYNGVEIQSSTLHQSLQHETQTNVVVGAIGRLVKQKNFSSLIKAFSYLKIGNLICKIAGEGEDKKMLETMIKTYDLEEKIKLLGWQKNPGEFFDTIDIVVIPSLWEGHPLVLLEAGIHKLPVIAARISSIMEIVEDGEDVLLYTNEADLATKLESLSRDVELRQKLGKNLREKVERNFSLPRMIRNYEELYLHLYENN